MTIKKRANQPHRTLVLKLVKPHLHDCCKAFASSVSVDADVAIDATLLFVWRILHVDSILYHKVLLAKGSTAQKTDIW